MSTELQDSATNLLVDLQKLDDGEGVAPKQMDEARATIGKIVKGPLPVWTYVDLSTSHITENDSLRLKRAAKQKSPTDLIVREYEEGFFIHVPLGVADNTDTVNHMIANGYSLAMVALFRLAKEQRLGLIRLDRDGTVVEELEHFNW
jgi:hypothetical protein